MFMLFLQIVDAEKDLGVEGVSTISDNHQEGPQGSHEMLKDLVWERINRHQKLE